MTDKTANELLDCCVEAERYLYGKALVQPLTDEEHRLVINLTATVQQALAERKEK